VPIYLAGTTRKGPGTTGPISTVGASLLVFATSGWNGGAALTVADSLNNLNWLSFTTRLGTIGASMLTVFYHLNPIVGPTHQFSVGGNPAAGGCIAAFGEIAPAPLDQTTGLDNVASPAHPGALTPSLPNSLIVTARGGGSNLASSVDGGFTKALELPGEGGVNYDVALGFLIQTTPTIAYPGWTVNWVDYGVMQAIFKAALGQPTMRRWGGVPGLGGQGIGNQGAGRGWG